MVFLKALCIWNTVNVNCVHVKQTNATYVTQFIHLIDHYITYHFIAITNHTCSYKYWKIEYKILVILIHFLIVIIKRKLVIQKSRKINPVLFLSISPLLPMSKSKLSQIQKFKNDKYLFTQKWQTWNKAKSDYRKTKLSKYENFKIACRVYGRLKITIWYQKNVHHRRTFLVW